MKEVVSIEESDAVKEDIKKLEDTMAVEGIAPMITKRFARTQVDEERLAEYVSVDIEEPAPSEPINVMEEYNAEVEIEGVGIVKVPISSIGKVYTPPVANVTIKNRVFNSGLKVIKTHNEKVPVIIPLKIISICHSLQRKVGNSNEFSIVCKGQWDDDGNYVVSEDYKVPKQEVAGASVDYDIEHLEQLKMEGYTTVIHAHPFKSSNFSQSDDETINSHFQCSVLYSIGEFTTATISITAAPGLKLVVTGEPRIEGEDNIVPESEFNNIEKKYKYNYNGYDPNLHKNQYPGDDYWDTWGINQKKKKFRGSHIEDCEKEYEKYCNHNKSIYDYNAETDVLYKNGKPIHRSNQSRISRSHLPIHSPIQGHECGCKSEIPPRIFRTEGPLTVNADQKSGIFKTDGILKKEDSVKSKNKKNK